jgi:aspartyl-tRNA(Asn)/glutamyl-tRNA(Gln) amidotransferase subunit A
MSIRALQQALQAGATSAHALTEQAIARAEQAAPLNAIITPSYVQGRLKAAQNQNNSPGARNAVAGIPMVHKDLFCTPGIRTTCGSKMLGNFIPPYAATIVERLDQAGAICIGKANMDEFAMGSSNELSAFGAVKNPWDHTRVPGGSSGGSAALVAARVVPYATASDTGGSIRQPAAFCGVTGLKPTYGRVSRFGMVAYGSSLDAAGVIAQSAEDCAQVLSVMAGHDARDGTCSALPVPDFLQDLCAPLRGVRIGLPRFAFGAGVDGGVEREVRAALKQMEALGAQLVDIELAHAEAAIAAYYVIAPSEASSNLSRFDGVRYGYRCENAKSLADLYARSRSEAFGDEVQTRILVGTYALSSGYFDAYYLRAQRVRRLIAEGYALAFQQVDLIAMPTTPTTAFKLGEKLSDARALYLADIFTVGVNLAGLPAISIPCGFDQNLPVGLQLIAPPFAESKLLSAAHQFQTQSDFHLQRPRGAEAWSNS